MAALNNCWPNSLLSLGKLWEPLNELVRFNRYTTICAALLMGLESAILLTNCSLLLKYRMRNLRTMLAAGITGDWFISLVPRTCTYYGTWGEVLVSVLIAFSVFLIFVTALLYCIRYLEASWPRNLFLVLKWICNQEFWCLMNCCNYKYVPELLPNPTFSAIPGSFGLRLPIPLPSACHVDLFQR